jgi:hypothetical protein
VEKTNIHYKETICGKNPGDDKKGTRLDDETKDDTATNDNTRLCTNANDQEALASTNYSKAVG